MTLRVAHRGRERKTHEPARADPRCCRSGPGADRRRRRADIDALEDTLVRVSHLAMHLEGHLAELDINPLMVLPSGQGVKAVDALVVFRGT